MISMQFESRLSQPQSQIWNWITSIEGISKEMAPYLRMTVPQGVRSLKDLRIAPGRRLFRSSILLFGILPIDASDLTILEIREGQGFIEQSPMGSMKVWRHERFLEKRASDSSQVYLIDKLTFEPRFATPVVSWMVQKFFEHRHKILRQQLG